MMNFVTSTTAVDIVDELEAYCEAEGLDNIAEVQVLVRPGANWRHSHASFALADGEEREVVVPAHVGYDAVVFRVTRRGGALATRARRQIGRASCRERV